MQGAHEEIVIHVVDCRGDESAGSTTGTPYVIPAGSTLQDLLSDCLDLSLNDVEVRVEGRSVSRLHPLLAGERVSLHDGRRPTRRPPF